MEVLLSIMKADVKYRKKLQGKTKQKQHTHTSIHAHTKKSPTKKQDTQTKLDKTINYIAWLNKNIRKI